MTPSALTIFLFLIALLIFWSALFSGLETALFSLKSHQLRRLEEKHPSLKEFIGVFRQNPRRVLNVLLLGDVFAHEGYHFTIASDGASMRRGLASPGIDVVIVDVGLPGGETGLALAEEAADRGCGVILVTGHGKFYEDVEKSGHRYLFKPFRLGSLLELVDHVLRETQARCVKSRTYGTGAAP